MGIMDGIAISVMSDRQKSLVTTIFICLLRMRNKVLCMPYICELEEGSFVISAKGFVLEGNKDNQQS